MVYEIYSGANLPQSSTASGASQNYLSICLEAIYISTSHHKLWIHRVLAVLVLAWHLDLDLTCFHILFYYGLSSSEWTRTNPIKIKLLCFAGAVHSDTAAECRWLLGVRLPRRQAKHFHASTLWEFTTKIIDTIAKCYRFKKLLTAATHLLTYKLPLP